MRAEPPVRSAPELPDLLRVPRRRKPPLARREVAAGEAELDDGVPGFTRPHDLERGNEAAGTGDGQLTGFGRQGERSLGDVDLRVVGDRSARERRPVHRYGARR